MTELMVGFWNLENLFAPENHPDRLAWIANKNKNDLVGWSEALFDRKISQLAKIIQGMNEASGPDILGVCEVENRFVLDRLVGVLNKGLSERDYKVVHADSERDKRGIDTAFIYDSRNLTVDPALIFSHFVLRRTGTRDILQATFTTNEGLDLVVLCNHWPSRSGGAAASAGFRATAGETLGYWHERIREVTGDTTPILAISDFNDDPFDPSVRFNAVAWRERADIERSRSARFYNMAWEYLSVEAVDEMGDMRQIDGTLYYKSDGNVFDQILVNRSLLKGEQGFCVKRGSAQIITIPEMVSRKSGSGPIRFGLPKGDVGKNVNQDGFSDHFPVAVVLELVDLPVS